MITKPTQMDFSNKKFNIIIAGVPGIGKTTLALSAPKPLLIDFDKGVSRVEAKYRQDTLTANSVQEVRTELTTTDLSDYETIVLDTGGKLFELMKPEIIKENSKAGKSDGSLSLQGYGIAKRKYHDFLEFLKSLNKHLVIIFHASEVVLDEETKLTGLRIRIEGSSRDEVWDDADLGGFLEMKGNKRTIGFSNCDRYYAKGTHGIQGLYEIPNLKEGKANTFLTDLIDKAHADLAQENKEFFEYKKVMASKVLIDSADDLEKLNKALNTICGLTHRLTSKEELWFALTERAKALGAHYDKAGKQFVADNPITA